MKTRQTGCACLISCVLGALAPVCLALENGSFEDGLCDWVVVGNVAVKSDSPYISTDGDKLVAFNSMNTIGEARIWKELELEPGYLYTVTFEVGNLGYNPKPQTIEVSAVDMVGVQVRRMAESMVEIPGTTRGRTRWETHSITFSPQSRWAALDFSDRSRISNGVDLVLDHVRISSKESTAWGVVNGGFEDGLEAWKTWGNVSVKAHAPYLASEGDRLAVFNSGESEAHGWIGQRLDVIDGQRYLVMFDVGNLSYNRTRQRLLFGVSKAWGDKSTFQMSDEIVIPGATGGSTTWLSLSYAFTANGDWAQLEFLDMSERTRSTDLVLDNVRVAPVSSSGQFINGSFETSLDGWSVDDCYHRGGSASVEAGGPYEATHGASVLVFNSENRPTGARIRQSVETMVGATYRIVFDVGNLCYHSQSANLRVSIKNGHAWVVNRSFLVQAPAVRGTIRWLRDQSFEFTAREPMTEIRFIDESQGTNGIDLVLDHVRILPLPGR